MLKLAGIIMLMFGCIGLGINKVSEEKRRIRELREIRNIVVRIQNEMAYGKRTLPEICLILGRNSTEPYSDAFMNIFQRLEENDGTVLDNIWKEQLKNCMEDMPLGEEEKNILISLPEHMGIMDGAMQAADIGQSLDMLTGHIVKTETEYENKAKVIMSVSVMAGLFLVIWLI
ncbi:MAG: stage III sporulation protein AB [Lachnospiraceae bacterium]|nr:stage III sporulation protein AB [Lachnospiraceae bacterium]